MNEAVVDSSTGAPIDPAIYARRWWTLGVLCLSLMIIMVSNGSLNVALPALAKGLHASASELQWIVDAYSLVFAGMLFAAGTLGDRFGRKGALQGGLLLFLVGTVGGMLATSATQVIAARCVMGVAAAFVMPSTLSILTNVFPMHERPKAISMWAAISAGGAALGPPISGALLQHFAWNSVFLVNVPLVLAALVLGRRLVPTSRNPDEHRLDVPGALLSVVGVGTLVFSIIEAPRYGWLSAHTLVAAGVASLALAAFVLRERTATAPMLDLDLFHDRRFSIASMGICIAFFAMFGMFFILGQYMQLVLGNNPLRAALAFMPMPIVLMIVAPRAPRLVARYGAATVAPAGMSCVAFGLAMLTRMGVGTPVWNLYLGLVPMGVGMAITTSPLTSLIMSAVPRSRAGMGSAMNDTTRELGGALGVAVLGSLLATKYVHEIGSSFPGLSRGQVADVHSGIAGAVKVAGDLGGSAGSSLLDAARHAYSDGMRMAIWVGAAVLVLNAVLARSLLPRTLTATGPSFDAAPPPTPALLTDRAAPADTERLSPDTGR